ncbi:hypothetical protein E2320_006640, partial [Naja naja]
MPEGPRSRLWCLVHPRWLRAQHSPRAASPTPEELP